MSEPLPGFDPAELEQFIQEYMELDRRVQRPKGIYSILPGAREGQYQYTLKYFLDPRKSHGFSSTLLDAFLECIEFHEFNLAGQHIEIDDEVWVADDSSDGRIDLVICGGSALADHPRWAVFIELKVGAEEGTGQTTAYAAADEWNFNWFDASTIDVDQLDETHYVYLKRDGADPPADPTGTFASVNWAELVASFEQATQDSLFEYPNRSVIQFTDFMQSLKETEGMDSSIDADELNERLTLYFEHSDLIQQVEQANSQFESDFEDVSAYLMDNWVATIVKQYDFETSGWKTTTSSNAKWQGILPEYWEQDPLNSRSTIKLYYRHSPTTDALRDQVLRFRLRLPPHRNVHTEDQDSGHSFNDVFTEKCTSEYADAITDALDKIGVDDSRVGSASALAGKTYQLDPDNLVGSYFNQLDTAVSEFCTARSGLPTIVNDVFTETYQEVFDEDPVGEFPGCLPDRD